MAGNMAKFTFTRDYDEKQPGGKRMWKAWKAGKTYTMTRQHAEQIQEQGYGFIQEVAGRGQEEDTRDA